jgi:hypothetical protein
MKIKNVNLLNQQYLNLSGVNYGNNKRWDGLIINDANEKYDGGEYKSKLRNEIRVH